MESAHVSDPVVVFRTGSEVEASIVRGLLEAHGIPTLAMTDMPRSVFPLAISGPWELRIAVDREVADQAHQIIDSHRQAVPAGIVVRLRDEFAPLEARIGYRFKDVGLLEHALTHRSRAHEDATGGVFDNESMEFLGDAVLGFVIADRLFRDFPQHDEGRKSKLKAWLVSAPAIAQLAERLGLGDFLLLGRGEERSGGRRKQALLADGYEALIAAIFLDGGIEAARRFPETEYAPLFESARSSPGEQVITPDFKSALQEFVQGRGLALPQYHVSGRSGPDHRALFQVEVRVGGVTVAAAEGRSKKQAAQEAARLALEKLQLDDLSRSR